MGLENPKVVGRAALWCGFPKVVASSSQRPQLATLDGNDLITELYGEGMKSASAAKIFTDHHGVPDILLSFYAHVLDASADMAAATMRAVGRRIFVARCRSWS